ESYLLVYIPSNIKLKLTGDWTNHQMTYLDLENKDRMSATAHYVSDKDETQILMHRFTRDALLIIWK
ncbi:MAG: beta-glucosidase, partial [Streptococcus sp.]|nr:beta-glucosidase [Streptococcus sp.]